MKINTTVLTVLLLAVVAGCTKTPTEIGGAARNESAQQGASTQAVITPEAARNVGIDVQAAGPAQIRETLRLYGSIRTNAEREQDVRARYPGVVREVTKRAGDAVEKGDTLLRVESNESLQTYAIRAPLSGRVLERLTNPGQAVDGSTVLMKVADLSTVWVEFAVFARDLGHVRPGMRVIFRGADADERGEARISYVSPAGHSDSQSVVARAMVDNGGARWVPGQFISGDVVIADVSVPVAVKPAAVQELGGKMVVFVQNNRGFESRPVQIGKRSGGALEIVSGLNAGERYAATSSYFIKADLLKDQAEED